ncbi:MAG: SagB/ThcOx family dehydrogenase [Lentimicrobiaceae bacterium]|nr:SagB/ThcOx family dehydrogenase [Lentimicrobiaceae bacterium]
MLSSLFVQLAAGQNIQLPKPDNQGGMALMQALDQRSSSREFSSVDLSLEHLSGLLWAACGINRPDVQKRTAPSARNWQDIQLYVALNSGIYLYHEVKHELELIVKGNHQAATGKQDFVADAPVNLIYVADFSKMEGADSSQYDFYKGINTGFISQNVYLYCASQHINTVVRAMVDREALHQLMNLSPTQQVVAAQSVGYKP